MKEVFFILALLILIYMLFRNTKKTEVVLVDNPQYIPTPVYIGGWGEGGHHGKCPGPGLVHHLKKT